MRFRTKVFCLIVVAGCGAFAFGGASKENVTSLSLQIAKTAVASTVADRGSSIPVTTVITHGFQYGGGDGVPGDWCYGMGAAILARAGDNGTMYEYDPPSGSWNYVSNFSGRIATEYLEKEGEPLVVEAAGDSNIKVGDTVKIGFKASQCHLFNNSDRAFQ